MKYLDLRITPSLAGTEYPSSMTPLTLALGHLKRVTQPLRYIVAEEEFNDHGEKTHKHYHIALEYNEVDQEKPLKKDTLQKWIRTLNFKGNSYCVRLHESIDDIDRWFRYCCKEKDIDSYNFTAEELEGYRILAKDEKARTVLYHKQSQEKQDAKNNFRNKMFKHFKELIDNNPNGEKPSDKTIWCNFADFYREKHSTPPWKKLDDIVIDFKAHMQYISMEGAYEMFHKN